MKKDCCNVKVTEGENGYTVEITGEGVKEKCKSVFENCCPAEHIKKCFDKGCGE
ncbi:MAG: hypothetical protein GY853_00060 [PVC group bacterium]|nr:hypothetical protein [PVC group bacterium]